MRPFIALTLRSNPATSNTSGHSVVSRLLGVLAQVAFLIALATPVKAQVTLDPDFDGDGRRSVSFDLNTAATDSARRIFSTVGGGYLVVGQASRNGGIALALTRLTSAGQVDIGFGNIGKRTYDIGASSIVDAAQDSQGRIIISGTEAVSGGTDVFLARVLSNGEIDAGFGFLGLVRINLQAQDEVLGVATGPADEVLVLVRSRASQVSLWNVEVVALDVAGQNQRSVAVSALPEAGSGALAWSSGRNALAVGLTFSSSQTCALRTFDVTLSGSGAGVQLVSSSVGGISLTGTSNGCSQVRITALAAVPGRGTIIMAGHREATNSPGSGLQVGMLVRFAATGSGVDPGFNNGSSRVEPAPFPATDLLFQAATVDPQGGILVAGNLQNNAGPTSRFTLWRYLPTGVPDTSFGTSTANISLSFPNSGGLDSPLALLTDVRLVGSRILLAGRSRWAGASDDDFSVAALRFPLDVLFANGFEP